MSSLHTLILLIKILHCTHGQIGFEAPTIKSVTGTTIGISFNTVEGADEYVVTAAQRYDSSQTVEEIVRGTTTTLLQNLTPSTLYDISIQARNSSADLGRNKTKQQTHPGAPTLTTSTPLPNTFLVFLNTANRARVSQWTVEYRPLGTNISKVVTTEESQYYVLRLVDLQPDTTYQVRGRASQIYNSINLTETEAIFSGWYSFTTDSLSVFARVTFVDRSSTNNTEFGEEWNRIQQELEKAYENLENLNSLDVIRKENETVYFRLKIKDKFFSDTSTSLYNLNGTQFSNFAVNNGDEAIRTPSVEVTAEDSLLLQLQYNTSTDMTEGGITNTFVLLSPEGTSKEVQIFSNSDREDSFRNQYERDFSFRDSGTYVFWDGVNEFNLTKNTVYGLEPKFLIRDFMKRQPNETLYALYFDIPGNEDYRFLRTTDMDAISTTSITNTSSTDGTSVTISFPSVDKATRYLLTGNGSTPSLLDETDIDGSERLTIPVSSLTPGAIYNFSLTTTQRKHDGRTRNVTAINFMVEPTIDPITSTVTTTSEDTPSATALPTDPTTVVGTPEITPSATALPTDPTTVVGTPEITPSATDLPTDPTTVVGTPEITPSATALPTDPTTVVGTPEITPTTTDSPTDPTTVDQTPEGTPTATDPLTESTTVEQTPEDTPTATDPTTQSTTIDQTPEGTAIATAPPSVSTTVDQTPEDMPTATYPPNESTTVDQTPEGTPTATDPPTQSTTVDQTAEGTPIATPPPSDPTTVDESPEDTPTATDPPTESTTVDETPGSTPTATDPPTESTTVDQTPESTPTATDPPTESTTVDQTPEGTPTATDPPIESTTVDETPEGTPIATALPTDPPTGDETPESTPIATALPTDPTTGNETPEGTPTATDPPTESTTVDQTPECQPTATNPPTKSTTVDQTPECTPTAANPPTESTTVDETPEGIPIATALPTDPTTGDETTVFSDNMTEDTTPEDTFIATATAKDPTTDPGMNISGKATEDTTSIGTTVTTTTADTTAVVTDTTTELSTTAVTNKETTSETTVSTTYTTLPPECNFQSNMTAAFPPERPHQSSTEFILSWNNATANYVVTVECIDCMDDIQYYRTKTSTMLFNSLKPGLRYRICVIAELCDAGSLENRTDCEIFLTNPPSIGNVSFIVGYSSVVIKWNTVPSATSYNVRVFLSSLARATQTNQELTNLTRPTATFNNLSPCDAYSVELTASNAGGGSAPVLENFNTSCSSAAPTTSVTDLPTTITRTSHPTASSSDPTASASYTQATFRENTPTTATSVMTHSISSDTPVPTKNISNPTTGASSTQPKRAEGTPWWFMFAVVLAIITTVACIAAITWYQKRRTGKFRTTQPQSQSSRA